MEPELEIRHFTDILDVLTAISRRTGPGDNLAVGFDEGRILTVALPLDLTGATLPDFVRVFCQVWAPREALMLVSNRTGEVPADRPGDEEMWVEMAAQCAAEDVILLDWFILWETHAFSVAEHAASPSGWSQWGFCLPAGRKAAAMVRARRRHRRA